MELDRADITASQEMLWFSRVDYSAWRGCNGTSHV